MPYPQPDEDKNSYISRCISELITKEGYKKDQATAICYKYWEKNESINNIISRLDSFLESTVTADIDTTPCDKLCDRNKRGVWRRRVKRKSSKIANPVR
jgi:hypothetical protein